MAGFIASTQRPDDRSKQIPGYQPEKALLSFMPRFSAMEDVPTPIVRLHLHAAMADASRQGRAAVAAAPEPPARTPSTCRLSQGRPQPVISRLPASPEVPAAKPPRSPAVDLVSQLREEEHRSAVKKFRPYLQVAAIRVMSPQPQREASPDPYGFRPRPPRRGAPAKST